MLVLAMVDGIIHNVGTQHLQHILRLLKANEIDISDRSGVRLGFEYPSDMNVRNARNIHKIADR